LAVADPDAIDEWIGGYVVLVDEGTFSDYVGEAS